MITPISSLIYAGSQMIALSSLSESMALQQSGNKAILNHKLKNGSLKNGPKVTQNIHLLCMKELLDQFWHLVRSLVNLLSDNSKFRRKQSKNYSQSEVFV
jgi:hypothetical protein